MEKFKKRCRNSNNSGGIVVQIPKLIVECEGIKNGDILEIEIRKC